MADHDAHDHTGVPGAGSPTEILDIPTAETDDTLVLAPDGLGGVEFRAETATTPPTAGAAAATVATAQSTTTTSYTDLATTGPAVTLDVNTMALVIVNCRNNGGAAGYGRMSFAASGANTIAAADAHACGLGEGAYDGRISAASLHTGLTPGSTTFTAKYKNIDGSPTTTFTDRTIIVIPLD